MERLQDKRKDAGEKNPQQHVLHCTIGPAEARTLDLAINGREPKARLDAWKAAKSPSRYGHGYTCFYIDHVLQADLGCDLDFLAGGNGQTWIGNLTDGATRGDDDGTGART